jgi:hypothetical protein
MGTASPSTQGTHSMSSDTLSAMITPVALLSGTGLLLLTTTNRFGRVVDRIRSVNALMENLRGAAPSPRRDFLAERYCAQLDLLEKRCNALRSALGAIHAGFSCFLGTSILLAVLLPFTELRWPAVVLACCGLAALFYATVSLTIEFKNSVAIVETDLHIGRSAHAELLQHAPHEHPKH